MAGEIMDHRDYLAREQQRIHDEQQFDSLFTSDPEADAASVVDQVLHDDAEELAQTAETIDAGYIEAINDAQNIRSQIADGSLDVDAAKAQLSNLRRETANLRRRHGALAKSNESITSRLADPAAHAAYLKEKYPALRGLG